MNTLPVIATEERLPQADGPELHIRLWRPTPPARAVLVIAHGFNAHSGHYDTAARAFCGLGLAVVAPDLRGRGRSEGERFYVAQFADYVADLARAVQLAKTRAPGLPVFLLGHSAGGVVACLYALDHPAELAGLVCESFAFRLPAPDFALAVLKGLSHVAPHAHVLRLKNEDFSRDPAIVAEMDADPLIADEVQPTNTVAEMVRADERLKSSFAQIRLPLLILHGSADRATRPAGSQWFHDQAGSADKTLKIYEGHYHDLLRDLGRERVTADIADWIHQRVVRHAEPLRA